jgi:hypothetical protein
MSVNSTIEEIGQAVTLVRDTNVSTYAYINPKLKAATYEYVAWFKTDSGVVAGDLVLASIATQATNFLVAGLSPDERVDEFLKINARLLRCNHTISLKSLDNTSKKFVAGTTDIPCLIIDGSLTQMSDRGVVTPGFGGKDQTYYLYCQPSGITSKTVIVDDGNRNLKIAGSINPFYAEGLIELQVKLEG